MMKAKTTQVNTILWADDDPDDLSVICEIIDSFNTAYKVKEVENGCAVLHYLHSIHDPALLPCLVVLDINMPKLTGLETLARIKGDERYTALNVAVFTTSSSIRDRQFCENYGAPLMTKPSSYSGFKKVITELLQLFNIEGQNGGGLD